MAIISIQLAVKLNFVRQKASQIYINTNRGGGRASQSGLKSSEDEEDKKMIVVAVVVVMATV